MAYFIEIWPKDESARLVQLKAEAGKLIEIERLDDPFSKITLSDFAHNNYVRLCDGDTTYEPYTTYRIKSVIISADGLKNLLTVKCEHIKSDLVETIIDSDKLYIQQTPNEILDDILTNYASSWSRGTITNGSDILESFEIAAGDNVYNAIKDLAGDLDVYYHAEGSDLGHDADWKEIDIVAIDNTVNGTPGTCVFEDAVNIVALSRDQDIRDNFFTRLYVIGGDANKGVRYNEQDNQTMTVAGALFTIYNFASGTITLYSKNCVIADDALNGYQVQVRHNGTWTAPATITDCVRDGGSAHRNTITVTGLSVTPVEGDVLVILYNAVTAMNFIPTGQSESDYGIVSEKYENNEFEDFVNQLGPHGRSDFSGTYTGGVCQGWAKIGAPTCSEDTTAAYIINGTKCQKVIANSDGDGLYREFIPVVDAGEQYSVSFRIRLTVTAIDADTFIQLRIKYDTDKYWPPGNIEVKEGSTTTRLLGSTFTTPRTYIVQGGNIEHVSGQTPRFEIFTDGGGATFYIDSVELVYLPYIPMPETFVAYDSRALLWEAGCKQAVNMLNLNQDYNIKIVDLYENDRTANAAYEFKAGDSVTVTHSVLGIDDTVRVMQKITPNLLKPTESNIKITSVNNGMAGKVNNLNHALKSTNKALSKKSAKTNTASSANMAGFYSVTEADSAGNILRIGKYVDESLINGTWVDKDRRIKWHQ